MPTDTGSAQLLRCEHATEIMRPLMAGDPQPKLSFHKGPDDLDHMLDGLAQDLARLSAHAGQ
jgi:hypothetical protein